MSSLVYKFRQNIWFLFLSDVTYYSSHCINKNGEIYDNELSILIGLSHDNIIRFYNNFILDNYLVLILKHFEYGTLFDAINTKGPLISIKQSVMEETSYAS